MTENEIITKANGPSGSKPRWDDAPDRPTEDIRRTITKQSDAPESLPADVTVEDAGAGSPFGIGPQSEAYYKRSRVVVNPKGHGENEH